MNRDETHCCGEMDQHLSCGELGIVYWPKFREYGLRYLDGGDSIQVILHCPWWMIACHEQGTNYIVRL